MKERILKNIKNRYVIFILILVITIVLVYFLMASRSFIVDSVGEGSDATVTFNSCASIYMESDSEVISLDNAYPVSDNVGLTTMPTYDFTLTNSCESEEEMTVYLVVNSESTLSANDIKVYYDEEINVLRDFTPVDFSDEYTFQYSQVTENDISVIYELGTYTLSEGETKSLSIQMWINSDSSYTENSTFNATFASASQNEHITELSYIYETILMNETEETTYEEATAVIEEKGEPTWGTSSSTNDGMYAIADEYGTSYYFRGAVDDNWIIFGTDENGDDMYWRITRINGDGSVRMVYTGTTAPTEDTSVVMTGASTLAGTSAFNSSYDQAEYVGYMYTLGEAHGTSESSTIKTALETWYYNNLLDETSQIADSYYCYDRTAATSGYQKSYYGYNNSTYSTTQTGTTGTLFAAAGRNTASSLTDSAASTSPSLICDNINDQYTASDTTYGNGELEYSIGLLTFDEAVLAGYAAGSNAATTLNYLYRGSYYIWLGSPFGFDSTASYASVSDLRSSGYVYSGYAYNSVYLMPAVSLSSLLIVEGDGTYESPYMYMII